MKNMIDIYEKYLEAQRKYCDRCVRKPYCYNLCPLVQSFMMDLPCTPELERICGYKEN